MSHFELALGASVNALAIAKQFADAKNGGKRIVEFVSYTGKHLAHGGKLLCLDELLFEALDLRNIAPGNNDAFDLAVFVEQGAEVATKAAPLAVSVAHLHFDGSKAAAAGDHVVIDSEECSAF